METRHPGELGARHEHWVDLDPDTNRQVVLESRLFDAPRVACAPVPTAGRACEVGTRCSVQHSTSVVPHAKQVELAICSGSTLYRLTLIGWGTTEDATTIAERIVSETSTIESLIGPQPTELRDRPRPIGKLIFGGFVLLTVGSGIGSGFAVSAAKEAERELQDPGPTRDAAFEKGRRANLAFGFAIVGTAVGALGVFLSSIIAWRDYSRRRLETGWPGIRHRRSTLR